MEYSFLNKIEKQYLEELDWEVKENANIARSVGAFIKYFLDKTIKNEKVVSMVFGERASKEHFSGEIHIHKLPLSLYIPYCAGWSFKKILQKGLVTVSIYSRPAKHLDSAVNQLINFFYIAAQEWTGAMATSAFDLFTAPFVSKDKLEYNKIKQIMQSFIYDLNYPSRLGYQSPFTNITIVLDTVDKYLNEDAIVAGKKIGVLGDYVEEAIKIVKALSEVYLEGDAKGQPFTFPIPTLFITKRFDWNERRWGDLTYLLFEVLSRRGTFYILNGYKTDVESLMAMCCRLNIDMKKAFFISNFENLMKEELHHIKGPRGIWSIPDATGSIGVITINLPRISIISNGDKDRFFEILEEKLNLAREILRKMRERYEKSLKNGLMPLTKEYINNLNAHYSTFGIVGLPEAAANMINPNLWIELKDSEIKKAVEFMREIVSFVRRFAEECEEKDGVLYNVEEVPAESTGYRLALKDLEMFKEKFEKGDIFIPVENGVPFYSNSIIPYYAKLPIYKRALYEGMVQKEFTGGVMMHLFLYEAVDPEALKKMVKKIVENTDVTYFSITPTICVCKNCGYWTVGLLDKCPKCSRSMEKWSRIVGYYRPVSNWNIGKIAEFKLRVHYSSTGFISLKDLK